MKKVTKVCPLVLDDRDGKKCLLAFKHPLAGFQFVKGTVEENESLEDAASRELFEESGIIDAKLLGKLGTWTAVDADQVWEVFLFERKRLSESWTHDATDDGGHRFTFFWHPLDNALDENWHPVFVRLYDWIRDSLNALAAK